MKTLLFDSKKRNYILILICLIVYISNFFLKYSYNVNIINFEQKYGVSHSDAGLVSSLFFITYGAGQFINGLLARKYNLKLAITIALVIPVIANVLLLFTPTDKFYLINIYWAINGAASSLLWPCIIRYVAEHVDDKYRDLSATVLGSSSAIGSCVSYALSSLFTTLNNLSALFIIYAVIGAIAVVVWLVFYKTISVKNPDVDFSKVQKVETTKVRYYFIIYALLCGLICIVVTFTRDGITNWAPSILNEEFSISKSISILLTILLPIGQFLGVLISSLLKKYVKSHMLLSIYFIAVVVCALLLGLAFNFNNKYVLIIVMLLTVLAATGVIHIIVDVLPLAWAKERNSGLFAGIFNGCCYIGASIATYGLSLIADNKGWNMVFKVILIICASLLLITVVYYLVRMFYRLKKHEN